MLSYNKKYSSNIFHKIPLGTYDGITNYNCVVITDLR